MEKEALIELLKSYKENKTKLKMNLKELENKKVELLKLSKSKGYGLDVPITSSFGINQDIHSKNQISDKVLKAVERKDEKVEKMELEVAKLEETINELKEKVEIVEDRLECLKYREKKLLMAYYIEGRTYSDIGDNLYFELFKQTRSSEAIKIIIEKALHKMVKL